MVDLPTRYYVQRSQTESAIEGLPSGWQTIIVTFDRASAEQYAEQFERTTVWEQGVDVTDKVKIVARVMTAEELGAEGGDALLRAEIETRIQFWQRLAVWAEPLSEPTQK
jgi:hypothetical protein